MELRDFIDEKASAGHYTDCDYLCELAEKEGFEAGYAIMYYNSSGTLYRVTIIDRQNQEAYEVDISSLGNHNDIVLDQWEIIYEACEARSATERASVSVIESCKAVTVKAKEQIERSK